LQLRRKLVAHKVNGREKVKTTSEHGNCVSNVHPLCPTKAGFERRVEVLVPSKDEVLELRVLNKGRRLAIFVECKGESQLGLVNSSLAFLVVGS
jgi:hypothetical protein